MLKVLSVFTRARNLFRLAFVLRMQWKTLQKYQQRKKKISTTAKLWIPAWILFLCYVKILILFLLHLALSTRILSPFELRGKISSCILKCIPFVSRALWQSSKCGNKLKEFFFSFHEIFFKEFFNLIFHGIKKKIKSLFPQLEGILHEIILQHNVATMNFPTLNITTPRGCNFRVNNHRKKFYYPLIARLNAFSTPLPFEFLQVQ